MSRDEVARHQRARLYWAMIEAVSERGYAGTTVADVIGLAGVSRRTFYEQFSDKETCFEATHDIVVGRARKRMIDAWRAERDPKARPYAACSGLFDDIAAAPAGARLVLIDSPAAGARGLERSRRARRVFERALSAGARQPNGGPELVPVVARAIVGGFAHVVALRLAGGRERELPRLAGPMHDWAGACRAPAALWTAPEPASSAPVAHPSAPPASDGRDPDDRRLATDAAVALIVERGLRALTEADIADRAGISSAKLRRWFVSKEACLLAALESHGADALAAATRAMAAAGSWPRAVRRGAGAFAGQLLGDEPRARLVFVHAFELGAPGLERAWHPVQALTRQLTAGARAPRAGGTALQDALAGAIWAVLADAFARGRLASLDALVDFLAYLVLAPYLGPRIAAHEVRRERAIAG